LQGAWGITADLAVRRDALLAVAGFDERFPRAYREDADLILRLLASGYQIVQGLRQVTHPVRPAGFWISLYLQAGNQDDVLMQLKHGPGWHRRARASIGRIRRHEAISLAALISLGAFAARRRQLGATAGLLWLAGTAELAWSRIKPGPRFGDEILRMLITSACIPPAATYHRVRAWLRWFRLREQLRVSNAASRPEAVLFDRDGTLVVDVPYNRDPSRVVPMPGAKRAVERLRRAGIPTAVISNQSGVGRGWLSLAELDAVNQRVEDLLGPLGPIFVCPHTPEAQCNCRKPAPGLIQRAAAALGVAPSACAVIGDIGADVQAATAVGARAILVPTIRTRAEEIDRAQEVAASLEEAVGRLLEGDSYPELSA
jgi:histidinol-phosphate phosphatase family protein